jgi:hypothetical protein
VLRMRPACGIAVAMHEQAAARLLDICICSIARSVRLPEQRVSAVVFVPHTC